MLASVDNRYILLNRTSEHIVLQNESINNGDAAVKVLAVADESRCEPLQSEIVPDPMDAEQTWPDEFDNAEDTDRRFCDRCRSEFGSFLVSTSSCFSEERGKGP